jgi:hypothetical protein
MARQRRNDDVSPPRCRRHAGPPWGSRARQLYERGYGSPAVAARLRELGYATATNNAVQTFLRNRGLLRGRSEASCRRYNDAQRDDGRERLDRIRDALRRYYHEGESQRELAVAFRVRPATVYSWIHSPFGHAYRDFCLLGDGQKGHSAPEVARKLVAAGHDLVTVARLVAVTPAEVRHWCDSPNGAG